MDTVTASRADVRALLKYDWRTIPLFVNAMPNIKAVHSVLDVGAGIRPQSLVPCNEHTCMEPHGEYADALESAGFAVIRGPAPGAFDLLDQHVDTVTLIDVIEHMEKRDGMETIRLACERARHQVIVFTPLGFMEQSGGEAKDAWGMQGQHWQKHLSGWTPDEFPGWLHLVDAHFAPGHAAFLAIWNKQ